MRRQFRHLSFAAAVLGVLSPVGARADVASWLFAGGGPEVLERPGSSKNTATSLQLDTGLGTSAANLLSFGALVRLQDRVGDGWDTGLLLRLATRGYCQGDFGLALDFGGYDRFWGDEKLGIAGGLSLGAPWGITLNLQATQAPDEIRTYTAMLGVDLARLTVYRSTGLGWWSNPFPTPRERQ